MTSEEIALDTVSMVDFIIKWCHCDYEGNYFWKLPYTDITICVIDILHGFGVVPIENNKPITDSVLIYPTPRGTYTNAPQVKGFESVITKFNFCKQFRYRELEFNLNDNIL